ncbi:DUF502 domain-containing protein [Tistrella mobilis]|jgi:uncharacterized membrane protein|uniref:DUF502 domain-containing protein n=1 Tax=Tistrella mobilis TaxID=171437 RepID=UPI0035576678
MSRRDRHADSDTAERPHGGGRLRRYFLAGIVVTAPIAITLYVAWWFIAFVDDLVLRFVPPAYHPDQYLPFSIPGAGLIVVVIGITLIGAFAAGLVGRELVRLGEGIVARMPVLRSIYAALKQIFETVLTQGSQSFREVVLIEYPRRGLWSLAFITGTTGGEIQRLTKARMVNVFVPTTPNPTSGFLLFVPETEIVRLAMTVEEGVKLVISGGLITPPDAADPEARAAGAPRAVDRREGLDKPDRNAHV